MEAGTMRAKRPTEVCPITESFPWEWVEFVKVGWGYIPVALYETYGSKVRWWMTTHWQKNYSRESIRRLKQGTSFA